MTARTSLLALGVAACAPALAAVPQPSAPAVIAVEAPSAAPAPKVTGTPDAPFRQQPPRAPEARPFVPPAAVRLHLSNGIPVWLVAQPSHYCSITVVAVGGAADVVPPRAGSDDLVTLMLAGMVRGTRRHTYGELEDQLASLQMPLPTYSRTDDALSYSTSVTTEQFAKGAELLADVVLHPSFEKESFERVREQDARGVDDEPTDPGKVAEHVVLRAVFGAHPYGSFVTAKATRAIARADVVALHARAFDPSRLSIVVAGDIPEADATAALEPAFGKAKAASHAPAPTLAAPTPGAGPVIVVVDKPGASTASIAAGYMGSRTGAPDDVPTRMALHVAMNGTIGRATRLRDEQKIVPWIGAYQWTGRVGGMLAWRTRAATDRVATVLTEVDRILHDLASAGPTADEVDGMRRWMASAGVFVFETPTKAVEKYAELIGNGLPEEYLAQQPVRLAAITADDVRGAAAKYLDRAHMRVVVVGDMAALREPLAALGWGPIEVRDVTGEVVGQQKRTAGAGR